MFKRYTVKLLCYVLEFVQSTSQHATEAITPNHCIHVIRMLLREAKVH